MKLVVHPRIHSKHPELSDDDIRAAFNSIFKHIYRADGECVGVGMDNKRRLVELIFRACDDTIVIYHGFTPPTQKVMKELGMLR